MDAKRCAFLLASSLALLALANSASAEEPQTTPASIKTNPEQRLSEVVVSHTDSDGILQLYRMYDDGTNSRQLTHSERGCRMPACSPDGKRLVYVQQVGHGLSLWISDLDGKNAHALSDDGGNLLPSWLPDSKHVVWMKPQPGKAPSHDSQIHLMNTETGESRRLFTDPEQLKFSNSMPAVSPRGKKIAFVSNRGGEMRIWMSDLDGRNARAVSAVASDLDETLKLPVEQKVPVWSPDGTWIAHWEGVEMIHLSKFTGKQDRARDKLITQTWNVWVVGSDGKNKRKVGRGDDPTWSPDGFVTRAFPDQERGGPKVVIETKSGDKELPIVPRKRNWGRFTWLPHSVRHPAD